MDILVKDELIDSIIKSLELEEITDEEALEIIRNN